MNCLEDVTVQAQVLDVPQCLALVTPWQGDGRGALRPPVPSSPFGTNHHDMLPSNSLKGEATQGGSRPAASAARCCFWRCHAGWRQQQALEEGTFAVATS